MHVHEDYLHITLHKDIAAFIVSHDIQLDVVEGVPMPPQLDSFTDPELCLLLVLMSKRYQRPDLERKQKLQKIPERFVVQITQALCF